MTDAPHPIAVLGLGAMGRTLAEQILKAGHPTTVWNRSPERIAPLSEFGADPADTVADAVRASAVLVACLYDHASVHEVLDPVVEQLAGRTLINVTTTTPEQSRELAAWAARHQVDYLDGGIMAVPEMIGQEGSLILYSGSASEFERLRPTLELWGTARFLGDDAGLAPLYDLAILAPMYTMFAGFLHGAAMVASAGVPARELAELTAPFLAAMAHSVHALAAVVDGGDYTVPGQQSLDFSDLGKFVEASEAAAVDPILIDAVQTLIRRQIDAGFGDHGFARIYQSLRRA